MRCKCSDPGCKCCQGHCARPAEQILYRVDMDDETGTAMCEGCADGAFECGLFCNGRENELNEDDVQPCPRGWDYV